MTKARLDGLYLLLLGALVFILAAVVLASTSAKAPVDFRVVYYPARCLIQHGDPYKASEVQRIYRSEGGSLPSDAPVIEETVTQHIYPPSAFVLTVPFAMLPLALAHFIWTVLTVGGLVLAASLMWNLGAEYAPVLSGALVGFLLANSEVLIATGNAAGIAISLCVVAVWCFLRGRFVPLGILCLALSLAVKPHDAGLVWLYFLFAGGVYRKRALQTLLATVILGLPSLVWVWYTAPQWMREWNSNLSALSAHGGPADPGPASLSSHGLNMVVSLQAAISVFRDDPRIYNPVSYMVCAPLLLAWAFVALRSRGSRSRAWLGIAAVAALSMLPIYHRQYDTKLLLLTVPGCAMLWAEGGLIGWLAFLVNAAGFVVTGDIPWVILIQGASKLHLPTTGLSAQMMQAIPVPLILLAMSVFYVWAYVRRSLRPASRSGVVAPFNETADSGETSL
jgi:hypothetical protein